MWGFRTLASRVRGVFTGNQSDRELNNEIEEHLRRGEPLRAIAKRGEVSSGAAE